jgi:CubicO group peptidase (beta-lactamase class C family)
MLMLLRYSITLLAVTLISCTFRTQASVASQPDGEGRQLLTGLIKVLNTKDVKAIEAFIQQNGTGDRPAAQRAERLMVLSQRGAPFTVLKDGPELAEEVRALVQDKNGEKFNFVAVLKGSPPKIVGLRLDDPESFDAAPPKDFRGWTDLHTLAEDIRKDSQAPALGLAVIHNGALEQFVTGSRAAAGTDPVRVDDPWSIGSIGKSICTTVIARLIEMGKLNWNTTIGDVFADVTMKPGYRDTTIEQIMHHRGGIPEDPGMRRPDVVRIVGDAKTPTAIRENYARDIFSRDPIGKPGEKFAYSNAGYDLLGVIAERTMKKSYEQLVKELVFQPLGLNHSYTGIDKLPSPRPDGHVKGPKGWETANFSGPMEFMFAPAGGGIFMSISDLAKFGEMHLRGLRGEDGLLKAATIQRLHKGIPEQGEGGRQYACGWGIEEFPGIETMHMHNGSNGTFRSQLSIFPTSNLVVACMVNCGGETQPSPPMQAVLAVASRYAKK